MTMGKEYAMPIKILVYSLLLALFGLLSVQNLPAQTASVQTAVIVGKVTDISTAEPLGGVSARLLDGSGKVKSFTNSNAKGVFRLKMPAVGSRTLKFARMGYADEEIPLDSVNPADTLRVEMLVQAFELKEVGVRARRIRENGDTVTYTVGQFSRAQDRSIGDVMKRMPGLDVDASGKVQYQGTDINKMYVEGNDIAGSKYGTLTQNIQADNVGAVEVLENHQPMQVLRGLAISDQAAINLKLKEKAKIKVMAHGTAAGGWGENAGGLYAGELFLMSVKGKVQNATSLKLNNLGQPLGGIKGFFGGATGEGIEPFISAGGVGGGYTSRFGRSAAFETTSTWKNNHDGQWRLQAEYAYDHLWTDRSTITTYFLPTGNRIITEDRHADSHSHSASLSANYEINQKRYYLNNNLTGNFTWNGDRVNIEGTLSNRQHTISPYYDVANRLKIIRRFGENRIVTFNSTNQFLSRPEQLWVETTAYGDMARYGSHVGQHSFFTDERASYGFIIRKVIVSLEGGVAGFVRHLDSQLNGTLPDGMPDESNDLSTNYVRVFIKPKFELNLKRISFNLNMPVNFYSYFFGGALKNRSEVFISPTLSMQWKPNSRHTINLNATWRRNPASLSNIHSGLVMADYRTFNAGVDDYYSSSRHGFWGDWSWRNTRRGWFAHASFDHAWNRLKSGVSQMLIGDYVVNAYRAEPSTSQETKAYARIQKSLDAIQSSVQLNGSFRRTDETAFSQGEEVNRRLLVYTAFASLDVRFCSWLNAAYYLSFSHTRMHISMLPSALNTGYDHMLEATGKWGKWMVSANGVYGTTRLGPGDYTRTTDLGVRVNYKLNKRVEFTLKASNLLDDRNRVTRSFDTFSQTETAERLRGREFMIGIVVSN